MRIGIVSDTHLGITKLKSISKCLHSLAEEKPDIVVHAGDFCGGREGCKSIKTTSALLRQVFPNIPIVAVLGNHDRWTRPIVLSKDDSNTRSTEYRAPSLVSYTKNYNSILQSFKDNNIHFLDEDGVYRYNGITILGHSGWYKIKPNSNDFIHIPVGLGGDTHHYLLKQAEDSVMSQLDQLSDLDTTRIFLSHHPVIEPRDWGWDSKLGDILISEYNVTRFINGHMHERHEGPLKWESGSDYNRPRYVIMDIP